MKPVKDVSVFDIINPREAARYLGIHPVTLYRLAKKGKIPGFKVGGQWRFKKDLIDAWIADTTKHGTPIQGEEPAV